jgi:HD superfamily phosphohydrolase
MGSPAQAQDSDLETVLRAIWPSSLDAPSADIRAGQLRRTLSVQQRLLNNGICGRALILPDRARFLLGGNGVVIQCAERDAPDVQYALKVVRPSIFSNPAQIAVEFAKAKRETQIHLPLSHENIAKNYGYGFVEIEEDAVHKTSLPCTLIEWVDGATPLNEYLENGLTTANQLAALLAQTLNALHHLHIRGYVHWDLKGDNVLVSRLGQIKLMDLGNARPVMPPDAAYLLDDQAETTDRNLPPELQRRMEEATLLRQNAGIRVSRNRAPVGLYKGEQSWDRPWLDAYMLAREVNLCLGLVPESTPVAAHYSFLTDDAVGRYGTEFVSTVLRRLLAKDCPASDEYYSSAGAVARSLERLQPTYGEATRIEELGAVQQHVLRLPPDVNVPWTRRVADLLTVPALARLQEHRQLSTVHHVFPGARHTRWEHALGALSETLQIVRSLYADNISPRFRLDTSELDVLALMLAVSVHDIGHPAFGHQLEESPIIEWNQKHEAYATAVLSAILGEAYDPPQAGADAEQIAAVLEASWVSESHNLRDLASRARAILELPSVPPSGESSVARELRLHVEILHSVVSGQLDADKRDYLRRDAHHCGVAYPSGIDQQRLDQALTTVVAPSVSAGGHYSIGILGVGEKGILPLESLIIARYQMFRAVYWHHTVRVMTVMLQSAIEAYVIVRRGGPPRIDVDRLSRLLVEFRARDDDHALAWLRNNVAAGARALCDGAGGDRARMFWPVAEFYSSSFYRSGVRPGDILYRQLVDRWSPAGLSGLDTILQREAIRHDVVAGINSSLTSHSLRTASLTDSDVLLDVPVAGKDQVNDLYVMSSRAQREAVPLQDLTPLAAAVGEAFERSVRKARVFVRPEAAARLSALLGGDDALADVVARSVGTTVNRQLPLEFA